MWIKNYGGSGLDFGFRSTMMPNRDLVVVGETGSGDFAKLALKGNAGAVILLINSGLRQRSP